MRTEEGGAQILDTLRLVLRLLEITNRHVESEMGWSHGYLSRIFAGNIELRVSHVLEMTAVIGLHPAELFDLVWPVKPQPPTPVAARLDAFLRRYQPPPHEVTQSELTEILKKVLGQLEPPTGPTG